MPAIFCRAHAAPFVLILMLMLPGCSQLLAMVGIEEPAFQTLKKEGDFELRQYPGFIVAETYVSGTLEEASNAGFKAIADYIFGNNLSVANAGTEKIAMTAPVTTEQVGDRWRVHFVMPSKYTLATLPKPVNPQVQLRKVAGNKVATLRFSGVSSAEKMKLKTAELQAWMKQQGLVENAAPQLARYNPPITPSFMRRNEILIGVQ